MNIENQRFNEIGWVIADVDGTKRCFPAEVGRPEYDEIVKQNLVIAEYVKPSTPDPEPSPAEALMIEKGLFTKAEWLAKVKGA